MTYDEKRELRLQISQLLADAGLNQGAIKEMVKEELKNKIDRALDQRLASLDAECSSGNYLKEQITHLLNGYTFKRLFETAIKEQLENRVIQIVMKNVEAVDE